MSRKINIAGTGCALADFLYSRVDFNAPGFRKYLSLKTGDGGLSPGKLVFTSELETFAQKPYFDLLSELVGNKNFDSVNLGEPSSYHLFMLPKCCRSSNTR